MAVMTQDSAPHAPTDTAPRLRWLWRGLITLVLVGSFALVIGFGAFVATIPRSEQKPAAPVDGVVALTGGAQRISEAADLVAGGKAQRLLISGVNEKAAREEIIRHTPQLRAMMACCVDLDHRARNTIGNAIEARRWARQKGYGSLAIVTSSYHMPRTLAEFRHAMPDIRLEPVPVIVEPLDVEHWYVHPSALRIITAEYGKFLAARLRMLVEIDPEQSRLPTWIGGRKPSSPKPGAEGWDKP